MDEKQALKAACDLTGDSVEAVLSYRLNENGLVMVVDRGIAGAPKLFVPVDKLQVKTAESPKQPTKTRRARKSAGK